MTAIPVPQQVGNPLPLDPAAGFAQACYEDVQRGSALRGWLVIRGISDLAVAASAS